MYTTFESVRLFLETHNINYTFTHTGDQYVFYAWFGGKEHIIKAS